MPFVVPAARRPGRVEVDMRTRGFTLIEAMIVVAVVVLIAGLVLGMLGLSCGLAGSADHAEQEARAHASKLGWKVSGIACTGRDTDGDGYISCTVALEDGSRPPHRRPAAPEPRGPLIGKLRGV